MRRPSIRRSVRICGCRFLRSWRRTTAQREGARAASGRAFAYIDSRGRRRLPIHDASHVRNALARFSQVAFEDEDARDRARGRLLRAAKKHGIMPIGFISAQLQPQPKLPKGQVTFLLTDIEGSTELLRRLDDQYAPLLADIRRRVRDAVRHAARSRGVRPRGRCLRGVRTCPLGTGGGADDSANDARRLGVRRGRRAAANRAASRSSRAHRHRLRRPLGARRRAHLLRGPWRSDRGVLRRSRCGGRVAPGGRQPDEPRGLAIPRPARAGGALPGGRADLLTDFPPLRAATPAE